MVRQIVGISIVCLALAALLALVSNDCAAAAEGTIDLPGHEDLRRQRTEAAHRKRRIIIDNDGNEVVYYAKAATPQALLECRTTGLVGTQVDTIVYCTWSSGFGYFTHNTKVGEVFTCTAEGFSKNKAQAFIDQGADALEIVVKFCREHDIEVFWSMRMNDTHDAWGGWYSPYMVPQLKKDHPEWLVASKEHRSKVGGWTAVDYASPEIRDLAFRFVEEVCENYDIDGVMLDYFRHPVFFKAHAMGGRVGRKELDMMTDMMRRIRKMTEKVAARRGRPILIGVRVPDSVEYSRAIGLDVSRWMEEDLFDLLAVSGYFRLNPWEVSVELGRKYGVPVYACMSESRLKGEAGKLRKSLACYRGRAMNVWASGADGIYMFNYTDPKSPLWREMGDPSVLAAKERLYCTGARGVGVIKRWFVGGEQFLHRSPVSPERPRRLEPGKTVAVELNVGEELAESGKTDVTLRLQIDELDDASEVSVKLNGKLLPSGSKSDTSLEYAVSPTQVKKGANRLEITLDPGSEAKPVLQDLLLSVRPTGATE